MAEDRLTADPLSNKSAEELEQRIQDTRTSLTTKLSMLTDEVRLQVKDSIGRVTTKVEGGVEQVRETLDRVTSKVEVGVEQVSGSLDQSLHTVTAHVDNAARRVKSSLDVKNHVQQEPLKMVAIAAGVGFLLAQLGSSRQRRREERSVQRSRPLLPAPKLSMSPLALIGLAGGLLRPVLVSAAKTFVVDQLHNRISAPRADGQAHRPGGSPAANGPLYHY